LNRKLSPTSALSGAPIFLVIAFGVLIGFSVLAGIDRPFTQVYDADLHYLYRSLRFRDGLDLIYFDHTGYLYTLLLSWFLRVTEFLGLISTASLQAIPHQPVPGVALATAMAASRVFSIIVVLTYVGTAYWIFRRLSAGPVIAGLLTLLLAVSSGNAYHAITLRPELLSALFVMLSYYFIIAAQDRQDRARFILLALSAGCAYLAVLTKMQAIIPILLLPVLAVIASRTRASEVVQRDAVTPQTLTILMAAILFVLPFGVSHYFGGAVGSLPSYSWLTLGYFVAGFIAYALFRKISLRDAVNTFSALAIGLGIAFAINYVRFDHSNSFANSRFLDNFKLYANMEGASFAGAEGYGSLFDKLWHGMIRLPEELFVLSPPDRTAIMVGALLAALTVIAQKRYRDGFLSLVLALGAFGVFAGFSLRGNSAYYEPYYIFMALFALAIASRNVVWRPTRGSAGVGVAATLIFTAGLSYGNYQRYIAKPLHTAHPSRAYFCDWQKDWAPVFFPRFADHSDCWRYYEPGLKEKTLRFPLFPRDGGD
jgi:hypothetical protein